jgi:hypothetical protein
MILALDPGTAHSQYVLLADGRVVDKNFLENIDLLYALPQLIRGAAVCIEGIQCQGMAVGQETFTTCIWIGRFMQVCVDNGQVPEIIYRSAVKLHLCGTSRAKDPNVRQALLDRFGGKVAAIGKKASPGPLYGVSGHAWAALGLAVTFAETRKVAA